MESLDKAAIERVRKVNEFKKLVHKYPTIFKIAYYPGANLVLLRIDSTGNWKGLDQTGEWFEEKWQAKMN